MMAGQFLRGQPRWNTSAIEVIRARLVCLAYALEPTVFELYVDGSATGELVTVAPESAGPYSIVRTMAYPVPAGQECRWKCVSGPAGEEEAIQEVGLTMEIRFTSVTVTPAPDLLVRYVNGAENLLLFRYSPTSKLFSEASAGIATGRATIENTTDFSVTIGGTLAMRMENNVLQCHGWIAIGGVGGSGAPRLEFWKGARRLATLTQNGVMRVINLSEAEPVQSGSDRFEFRSGGVTRAALGPVELAATGVKEPIS